MLGYVEKITKGDKTFRFYTGQETGVLPIAGYDYSPDFEELNGIEVAWTTMPVGSHFYLFNAGSGFELTYTSVTGDEAIGEYSHKSFGEKFQYNIYRFLPIDEFGNVHEMWIKLTETGYFSRGAGMGASFMYNYIDEPLFVKHLLDLKEQEAIQTTQEAIQNAQNDILKDFIITGNKPTFVYNTNTDEFNYKFDYNANLLDSPNLLNEVNPKNVLMLDCANETLSSEMFNKDVERLEGLYNVYITNAEMLFNNLDKLKKVQMIGNIYTNRLNDIFYKCDNLEDVDLSQTTAQIPATKFNLYTGTSRKIKNIKFPKDLRFSNTDMSNAFRNYHYMKTIDMSAVHGTVRNASDAFAYCSKLETVLIPNIDFSSAIPTYFTIISGNKLLKNFSGLLNAKCSYTLEDSPWLTIESARNCINGLYDLTEGGTNSSYATQTLTFHPNVYAQLSENDIAIATAKGWEVVSYE